MRLRPVLLALLFSFAQPGAWAETLSNLYQVSEPVASQAPEERDQATQRALETLVLRLTGDPKAFASAGLAGVRKDPQQIISQFGYQAGPAQALQVDFDPVSTDKALRQAGLATWGANRPSILAWWLNETAAGATLAGDAQPSAAPLRQAAKHRGLPLKLPLADLEEQLAATAKNLEGTDPAPLQGVSHRYGADALLAVHASTDGSQWQAKWRLWLGNQREQGSVQAADQAALADAVMLAVMQRLAPRYIVKPGASSELAIEVQGMTLERYAELGRALDSLGARLQSVSGDKALYRVTASPEQIRAQMSLARLQEVDPASLPQPSAAPASAPIPAGGVPTAPATPEPLRFHW
ncbi:DUF2066 domain-containing protein [Pseudomonas sp. RIT-PI-S]|uniref:DUF2066 domain-containing protein n=1 Tax=Pseudomonas sp. RIT-PI-S TaxID=3035295 RepID=UPI0021D9D10B|nr:DUF2066 domain-containing protein [Pseudomonas sp. RIT-PI-S]